MNDSSVRHGYVDCARGLAVLIMIEAHTMDSWTRAVDRQGAAYRYAMILGGFAAPLFLFLAGLGCSIYYPGVMTLVGKCFPQAQSQVVPLLVQVLEHYPGVRSHEIIYFW